jgi:pyruvate formate lyase activating enzyme
MKEARFYEKHDELNVRCYLCAHGCTIHAGRRGLCAVRENRQGVLYSLVYGKVISLNIDPIEKKPFFHFLPGSTSMSIATVGCNFRCRHCQNFEISQYPREESGIPGNELTPEDIVSAAEKAGCRSISYTYTEPTVYFEFAYDCARIAKKRGIKNVFVSNGYTSTEAAREIAPYLDANEIDLKGDDRFYRDLCGARLQPVLDTIILMKELGVWVEITTLLIPGKNDSREVLTEMIQFIRSLDESTPWHVSRFYPTYKLLDVPQTPVETLTRARDLGMSMGLKYVYVGNVPGDSGESTSCPRCGRTVVERTGYRIIRNRIAGGKCPDCGVTIPGVWGEGGQ